jgi:hypothetical protein
MLLYWVVKAGWLACSCDSLICYKVICLLVTVSPRTALCRRAAGIVALSLDSTVTVVRVDSFTLHSMLEPFEHYISPLLHL